MSSISITTSGGHFTVSQDELTITLTDNIKWGDVTVSTGYLHGQYNSGSTNTNSTDYITLTDNMIFDGAGYTIDMGDNTSCVGLFAVNVSGDFNNAPTIKNLRVINGTLYNNSGSGFIVRSEQKFFKVENCSSNGTISASGSGGIAGSNSGKDGECTINQCYTTGIIDAANAGGITGNSAGAYGKCTITNCYSEGTISGQGSGGIAGYGAGYGGICTITNCYSRGEIFGSLTGGIVGMFAGTTYGKCIISNCYSKGTISGENAGGIAGYVPGSNGNVLIYNCYTTGNITGNESGGIVGKSAGVGTGLVAILTVYTLGLVSGTNAGEIAGNGASNVALYNTYSQNGLPAEDAYKLGTGSAMNANLAIPSSWSESDINTINDVPDLSTIQGFSNGSVDFSTWDLTPAETTRFSESTSNNPTLDAFENFPWEGYSAHTDTPTLQVSGGGAEGDPHIYPILGTSYDYHKLGWSRYFADHKNDFIINCYIERGEGYWNRRDMSYISHTVIHYKNSSIYIDNGFRGRATKIVNQIINPDNQIINPDNQIINPDNQTINPETPNNIKITEKTLPFDYDAKELCFNCCREVDDCWTNNMKCETDRREMIRNQITIETDKHKITFQNVNKYNRNPGKINLSLRTLDPSYEGIIVSKEFANKSLIRDCEDKTPLSNYYTTRSI